jgi:hypothetical protein
MIEGNGSATRFGMTEGWTRKLVRLGAAFGLAAASAAAQLDPEFPLVTVEYPMNYALSGASIGDWDRDGFGDILLGHSVQLHWMRSRGDGSFDAPLAIPGAMGSYGVKWADFNGDGWLDVVDNRGIPGDLRVALQVPGGSFAPPVTLATNSRLARLRDINGDGRPDLFVSTSINGVLSVRTWLNTPAGWQASPPTTLGNAFEPLLGEFNGDGVFDLAYLEFGSSGPVVDLIVRLGTGPGTYGPGFPTIQNTSGPSLRVMDVEGDGTEELLFVSNSVSVVRILPGPSFVRGIVVKSNNLLAEPADCDGDGDSDLVCNLSTGSTLLRNDGTGRFDERRPIATDPRFTFAATGDVNGDGAAELIWAVGNHVSVSLSDGQGDWSQHFPTPIPRDHRLMAVGDLDADGLADFVSQRPGQPDWQVQRGLGNGTSMGLARIQFSKHVESCELFDIDGDGALDAVGRANGAFELQIALNDGTGHFGPVVKTGGLYLDDVRTGDFNGDGKLDLVNSGPSLAVRLGDGLGAFGPILASAPNYVPLLGTGDFDNDGRDDVIEHTFDELRVRLGSASGILGSPVVTPLPGHRPYTLALGDYNGDAFLDAAWLESMAPPRLTRAFGTGTGQFSSPVTQGIGYWDTGTYLQSVRVGTDALDDLLLARNFTSFGSTEPIQIFETQVSGGLLQLASMPTDNAFGTSFVTDITGDGVAELLLRPSFGTTRGFTLLRR